MEIITVSELALMLRVSKETIYNWCKKGLLPYFQVGKHSTYRFFRPEIEAWLAKKKNEKENKKIAHAERDILDL